MYSLVCGSLRVQDYSLWKNNLMSVLLVSDFKGRPQAKLILLGVQVLGQFTVLTFKLASDIRKKWPNIYDSVYLLV